MDPHTTGPEHAVDREQVWTATRGTIHVTATRREQIVAAGQTLVLPADVVRRVRTAGEPAEALVAMRAGGRASVPGREGSVPLPWAQ